VVDSLDAVTMLSGGGSAWDFVASFPGVMQSDVMAGPVGGLLPSGVGGSVIDSIAA
jgi:hypothetical protein